jgi:DNA modification methylase
MAGWGKTHDIAIQPPRKNRSILAPVYSTTLGSAYCGDSLELLKSKRAIVKRRSVQLVFTSPPFPLNTKKSYGNLQGEEYIEWFASFAPLLKEKVTADGSIVIEIGNAWMPGKPIMSPDVMKAFLKFLEAANLNLCQEFIWYNPARLPSPIEWVNKERIRVKDAFTRIWWMSPTDRPKADNRRVLREYSSSMRRLIETGKYNAGPRPSEHHIGKVSFAKDNEGAIPPNVGGIDGLPSIDSIVTPQAFEEATNLLRAANTLSSDSYRKFCLKMGVPVHPARMPSSLVEFFVKFLTDENDLVLDPFAGSNTTGAVAETLGRRWLSMEAEWEYASHSIGRFSPTAIVATSKSIAIAERDQPDARDDDDQATELSSSSPGDMPLFTS